jgi:hypothetical protein
MTDLAEHASLCVRKLQPTIQLHLKDAVLGGQIFVPRQQILVRMFLITPMAASPA